MGMSPEQLGALTIAELEKAAERVAAALAVLREAGAWRPEVAPTPVAEAPAPAPRPIPVRPILSVAERAERSRLLAQIRGPEHQADTAAAEQQTGWPPESAGS